VSTDVTKKRELLVRLIVAEVIAKPGESPLARRRIVRLPGPITVHEPAEKPEDELVKPGETP
jgi:hypothetical protein